MGGHHAHRAAPETRAMRRLALAVVVPLSLLTLGALIALWPEEGVGGTLSASAASEAQGRITAIDPAPCPPEVPDGGNGCGSARLTLADGTAVEAPLPNGPGTPQVDVGDDVVLIEVGSPEEPTYSIVDHQRGAALWVVAAAFVLAVVAFGRWRGLAALAGLAVTFALLLLFVVPAILAGEPPVLVAVVGAAAIMLTVLYLTHGVTLATTVAVLGTLAALTLTAALSAATVGLLHLTGVTDDLSFAVGSSYDVDTRGLLLAGIVIGALGVLDDVTITQGATVTEIAAADPSAGFGRLYRAGSRVGRAHIASVINTIVLAYAGSALPLLILLATSNDSLGTVVTDQVIAQEIARSVVATLGLIAAVPITTALAAGVAVRTRRLDPTP